MKKLFTFLILILISSGVWGQTALFTEDFDDNTQYTVTLGGEGISSTADYFVRTDGSNIGVSYSGANGSNFFAAQDIDGGSWVGMAKPSQLTWSSIDISSYSDIQFVGLFASAATAKIDAADYIHVEYQIDGGGWNNLIWFENDGTTYNTYLLEDTDFSGDGDGTQLTSAFASFTKSIGVTGSTLDLRITVSLDAGGEDGAFDYFRIQGTASGSVANPTSFSASAGATANDIDLSWAQNGNSNNVMVAYNITNTFGVPSGSYSVGEPIGGGGTVIYNGSGVGYNHSGLSANTTYYYKAWSVDGTTTYSAGTEVNATTAKVEPTNHVTNSAAVLGSPSHSSIDVTWDDATGGTVPDGYLIKGSDVGAGSITNPVDGAEEADGGLVLNVAAGIGSASFGSLTESTTYYFKIYPYTNSGSHIDYKIDGTVPEVNVTTDAAPIIPDLIISEVADPSDVYQARYVELHNLSGSLIDFSAQTWYLSLYSNNNTTTTNELKLVGTIADGDYFVIAFDTTAFNTAYGYDPNMANSYVINANGDDTYVLYYGGNAGAGDIADIYGEIGTDGTGQAWEFLDGFAERNGAVTNNNATWTASEWTITMPAVTGDLNPLPVELTSFTAIANGNAVNLKWQTATEVDNYGFEIQRTVNSEQSTVWQKIAFVEGAGNSNSPKEYSYSDVSVVSGKYTYRLKQVDIDGQFQYSNEVEAEIAAPAKYSLAQNYPNPFNPTTVISYQLPENGMVNLTVFDVLGNEVVNLVNETQEGGKYQVTFNASNLASGIYFYKLSAGNFTAIKKLMLLK